MNDLNVIITGAGAPGIVGTVYSLKNNFDNRRINIVGTDIKEDVIGKYICDKLYKVPSPDEGEIFINSLLDISEKNGIEAIIPQVTKELEIFSKYKKIFESENIKVLVSDYESLKVANNKYLLTKMAEEIGIPVPKYSLVKSFNELNEIIYDFGYPISPVVVKLPISNGMRGLKIIWDNMNKYHMFMDEKPSGVFCTLKEFESIFEHDIFPELMVMEYLPNEEYTVDVLAHEGTTLGVLPRRRLEIKTGITFKGITENNIDIIKYCREMSEYLKLNYAFGFQFKLDENNIPKLLECNPRVQGTMAMATFAGANMIYSAVKLAMGEEIPKFKIKWDMSLIRYWGGIFVQNKNVIGELHGFE